MIGIDNSQLTNQDGTSVQFYGTGTLLHIVDIHCNLRVYSTLKRQHYGEMLTRRNYLYWLKFQVRALVQERVLDVRLLGIPSRF